MGIPLKNPFGGALALFEKSSSSSSSSFVLENTWEIEDEDEGPERLRGTVGRLPYAVSANRGFFSAIRC
jgi:hypothetical protein